MGGRSEMRYSTPSPNGSGGGGGEEVVGCVVGAVVILLVLWGGWKLVAWIFGW